MSLIIDFNHPDALRPDNTGGKGANLARLTQAGFPVPPGFVLLPQTYELFIQHDDNVFDPVRRSKAQTAAELTQACDAICQQMAQWPLPESLMQDITQALANFPHDTAFSVRSSATAEDLGGAAFAGQHETYLNCIGVENILNRIRDCWISLWSARAVEYRVQAGIGIMDTAMAVVVQQMVFNQVAGVGFCINPVTGNPSEQSIDANYGLGESVVGGECPVDHWIVNKTTGEIVEATIGEKTERIVASHNGTQVEALPDELTNQACLTETQIKSLCELMQRVEQLYGYPQDIEWGIIDGKLWLLQARPVTRIPPRWTRDESAERFPTVITPLAWDLVEEGFHQSLAYSFSIMGLPPFHGKWFALFDNYVYGNQNAVEVYAEGTANSFNVNSIEDFIAALPNLRKRYAWVQELPLVWSRDLDRYLLRMGELHATPLEELDIPQLWQFVLRVKQLGADYFLPNIAISITQRTLYKIVYSILKAAVGKQAAAPMFDRLLAYCETKTGFINKELYRLAQRIAQHSMLVQKLRNNDAQAFLLAGGFADVPDIETTFQQFLQDHGHREIEFDPYHPTWVEAPWLVVENLKIMLDTGLDDPAEKERNLKRTMMETERQLLAGFPEELRYSVQEIIRLARVYTGLDDIEHYQTTRLTLPFRKGLRALGEALQQKGIIKEAMDVFFAKAEVLNDTIYKDTPDAWQQLVKMINQEKDAYYHNRAHSPQWEKGKSEAITPTGDVLTGLPGSPGVAKGTAFKVLSQEDFADFPDGAVLIARTTNPAWTPLFYRASAVVTESGGPLSHGAVTAREIGLPAVMSVRGVLDAINNGDSISVDGSNGRVMLES